MRNERGGGLWTATASFLPPPFPFLNTLHAGGGGVGGGAAADEWLDFDVGGGGLTPVAGQQPVEGHHIINIAQGTHNPEISRDFWDDIFDLDCGSLVLLFIVVSIVALAFSFCFGLLVGSLLCSFVLHCT